jgi:hypothetical protein
MQRSCTISAFSNLGGTQIRYADIDSARIEQNQCPDELESTSNMRALTIKN